MFRKLRGFPHPDLGLWNFGRPNYAIYQTVRSEQLGPVFEVHSERSHVSAVVRALTDNLLRIWAPTYSAAGRAQALATYLGDKVAEAKEPPVVGVGVNQLSPGWLPASALSGGYGQGWKHRLYPLSGKLTVVGPMWGGTPSEAVRPPGVSDPWALVSESKGWRVVSYTPGWLGRENPWKCLRQ